VRVHVTPEQVKAAFAEVSEDPSFEESRELVARGGMPAEMIQALALRPEILRAFAGFGNSVYPGGLLERRLKELVIIEASRRNACQFCTHSHLDLVKLAGFLEDPLELLENIEALAERERLAVQYTRVAMTDSNGVSAELFAQLRNVFSDAEIVELTFLVGYINMLNLFNNCLDVRYGGEYAKLAVEDR
jgi:AhpD family alkylhydroperoxidase